MHIWPSKAILKTNRNNSPAYNLSKIPKGTSTADWQKRVAEFKMDKLIVLDKVPKPIRVSKGRSSNDS
jgi:hypothetical protein